MSILMDAQKNAEAKFNGPYSEPLSQDAIAIRDGQKAICGTLLYVLEELSLIRAAIEERRVD